MMTAQNKKSNITGDDGKKRFIFEANCYFIPEDEDLDEEEIITVIYLDDFLSFDGNQITCSDKITKRLEGNVAKNNLDTTCKNIKLSDSHQLTGNCNNHTIESDKINKCIGNNNSFFSKGEDFMGSCSFCKIDLLEKTNVLKCTCKDMKGRTRRAISPLNKFMMYEGEEMQCNDEKVK